MDNETLLMIPGPTNVPREVREAVAGPAMYHRGPEFAALLRRCAEGLQVVFQTRSDVLMLSASGTGGLEAAVTNCIGADDRVLAVDTGKFGERMGLMAEVCGAGVTWLRVERGRAAEPQQVADLLAHRPFKALLMVHNETSTGVTQNVATLARIARDYHCLTIVDCVSGLGGIPVRMDEWGLDVVVAGSQKALMLPPGLAFVALSDRAWEVAQGCKTPRYYFDLRMAREAFAKGQTPFTPANSLIQGLDAALDLMLAEGMESIYARHAAAGRAIRAAADALGLALFADPAYASNAVTAVSSPEGIDSTQLVEHVLGTSNILMSGGQGEMRGRIFRVGHVGAVSREDVMRTVGAIGESLAALGHACDAQEAVAAAAGAYDRGAPWHGP